MTHLNSTALDGNVLAGPLSELGDLDYTSLVGECLGCHDRSTLAEATVYATGTRYVVTCHECGTVLLVVVEGSDGLQLFLHEVSGWPLSP